LTEEHLRTTFFPGIKKDEKKVIAAFCKMSADNALKTKPKVSLESSCPAMGLLIDAGL
jgi:hypothetical protein